MVTWKRSSTPEACERKAMSATGLGERQHRKTRNSKALNVADLNTNKLTYARRAFLLYFLSQVGYSEDGELVRTGEDEHERHEQEKKLKEYVGSNQVKNLIRLIQVLSVIRPSTATWVKGSASVDPSTNKSMEDGKYTKFEVCMLIAVTLLVTTHIVAALRKLTRIYMSLSSVGMVKVHSRSKNRVYHKESCRYVQGTPGQGRFL